MTSPNKPTSKPSRVAKMSVKPIWRKKLVSSPTPMPKPITLHHEPSQENNHPNHASPNPYIKDTPTSPQVKLISQLEVHGAPISKEDINQKFLRSLPSLWNQIALIMRNKPDIDEIDIDDLYNNLKVYEDELKRSSGSNSASQNLAFLSSENTGSTNEVSTASGDFGVSTTGGVNQALSTPCAHDIAYSFLAQPTTNPQLENEDF
ncbi:hypothetical protein Tco_1466948 [Tanacetum coccineum]